MPLCMELPRSAELDDQCKIRRLYRRLLLLRPVIRPLGSVLYLWPPLVTAKNEMEKMLQIFEDSIIENLDS